MSDQENILQTAINQAAAMTKTPVPVWQSGDDTTVPQSLLVAVPKDYETRDISPQIDALATKLQPWRRKGTAQLHDLHSLIDWANRNKGDTSALFADTLASPPTLTCIADYLGAGSPVIDPTSRDPRASYCQHRAVYKFPLSEEWARWNNISGKALGKAELGAFVEENAKDLITPSRELQTLDRANAEPWEAALIDTARQIQGTFGDPANLIHLSRRFEVNETSTISTSRNPDTGESTFNFTNQMQQPDGSPVKLANMYLIAIPVFDNGALYRMVARFQFRKSGPDVKFTLTLHNPDIAMRDAIEEACSTATQATALPLLRDTPEQ